MPNPIANGFASVLARLRGKRGGGASADSGPEVAPVTTLALHWPQEGLLEVGVPALDVPLFRVRARRGAPPEESPHPTEAGAVLVKVPLAQGAWLQAVVRPPAGDGAGCVVQRDHERHEDRQVLEFHLAVGEGEALYRFEMSPALEPGGLAAPHLPSLFAEVPSVQGMTKFLRHLTEDRIMPRILQSLVRSARTPEVARTVERVARAAATQVVGRHPAVDALARLCRSRRLNPDSLEAFCLQVDIEREVLGAEQAEAAVAGGAPLPVTPVAALAVADLFGMALDERTWDPALGEYPEVREAADDPAVRGILDHLRAHKRSPLDILEDLGRDAGSERVMALTGLLWPLLPGGRLRVNDEQQALLPLLEASGRPVHPETLIALCLFVDIETGDLTVEHAESLASSADTWDTSMYAMMAAAGAFGLKIQAFALDTDPAEDPLAPLSGLADCAEGGLLACFRRPGETGRWWEWLRGEEEARRTAGWGMDFSGIVLAHFPAGTGGVPLRELEPPQLRGLGEVLSREVLALRQIQKALRRISGGGADRVSLRREVAAFEAAADWLASPAAEAADRAVPAETRGRLVRQVRREVGLDVRADRRLAAAAAQSAADPKGSAGGPAADLLGLLLLQAACDSPLVSLEEGFKHRDERALRALLLARSSALLNQEEAAWRALAASLLASAEVAGDRASRLGAEYPLAAARVDPDPDVSQAAIEALVRLALADVVPLPRAVEILAVDPADAPPSAGSALREPEVDRALRDMEEWLRQVAEVDPVRQMGLPLTDAAGCLDPARARPLAEVLAAIQQASMANGSFGSKRWVALLTMEALAGTGRALLESWRLLARALDRGLADLDPQAVGLEHRLLVEDNAPRLLHRCGALPHLGGPGRALPVYRVPPNRPAGPFCTWEKYRGHFVTEEAPFFSDLLELARRVAPGRVRIVRLPSFEPVLPEQVPEPPVVRVDTPVGLDDLEVLDPLRVEFLPLLRWMGWNRAELGLDQEPEDEVEAVLALAAGRKPRAPRRPRVAPAPDPAPGPPREEALEKAATALSRQFEVEASQEPILQMLREAFDSRG